MCSYRVTLTVGHERSARAAREPGGRATPDWRLYVRGAGGEDISRFVSKIVFTLHRSYTYPKRVIHEPPYEIRESGSGSFEVPIYVYIKHSTNPSKIKFRYKLLLQNQKPLSGSQKFSHVFDDPPEPVKTCLIEGGAKIVEPNHKKSKHTNNLEQLKSKYDNKQDLFKFEYDHVSETDLFDLKTNHHRKRDTDLFEPKYNTVISEMEKLSKVVTVNLDRVSEEQLKRKHFENAPVESKRRKTATKETEYGEIKSEFKDVYIKKENPSGARSADVKNQSASDSKSVQLKKFPINGGLKIRTSSKRHVKYDNIKQFRTSESNAEGEKLTETSVVHSLKKACKLVEMTPSEVDLVSQLYLSINKYDKNRSKDSLKLPSFTDPIYKTPELPLSLREMLTDIDDDSDVLR